MATQIVSKATANGGVEVLFFQKKTSLFSSLLLQSAPEIAALNSILQKTGEGPYGDGDWADVNGKVLLLLDAGKEKYLSRAENLRCASARLVQIASRRQITNVTINLEEASAEDCAAIIAGLHYGEYQFLAYKSKPKKLHVSNFELVAGERASSYKLLASQVSKIMQKVAIARDLVNEPGSSLTPQHLVAQAVHLGKSHGLKVTVKNADQLQREGYNGLISVGKGSPNPPAMVVLTYEPKRSRPGVHLGLLGKGLTFDTGGISLKPATDMWEMKMDMAGAAASLGAICAIADLGLPITVTTILCIAENRPSGHAQLPGDIFVAKNGKTVMVDNTDAEGRLVLTDGLWEAGARGVTHLVDIATLTGAVVRALGNVVAGLFTNSMSMGELVLESGHACGEKFWPLPLEKEYLEGLTDKVADLKNVSGEVGAITAALFLNEFVPPGVTWSHLDIAGTAFTKKQWKYIEHGSTGFGLQTMVEIARRLCDPSRSLPPPPPSEPQGKSNNRSPKVRPAAPVPPSTMAPRRRGRPPKSAMPIPRRRGRPPKNPPKV